MLKQVLVLLLLVTAVFAEKAYFALLYGNQPGEFIIELTDDKKIKHARDLVSGETDDEPHILGRIRKSPKPYNIHFSFHLDPETITFFNQAIEVCDASFHYTEENLEEACGAFLPGCYFCPWASRVVREIDSKVVSLYQQSFRTGGRYLLDEQNYY